MDRRVFLAIGLSVIVVVLTQVLFPNSTFKRPVPVQTDSTAVAAQRTADSVRAASSTTGAPGTTGAPSAATTPAIVGASADSGAAAVSAAAATTAAPAETTTVATSKAAYRVSSLGATLLDGELKDYRALNSGAGNVHLARNGEALLSYRLVVPGDTIPLSKVPFTTTRSAGTDGRETVQYDATVKNLPVTIRYTFAPDSYTVHAAATVKNLNGPGFLLIDMPSGLRSAEADTLEDARHLAYAYKPATKGAGSIPFAKLDPGDRRLEPGPLSWVVTKSKYFLVGILAPAGSQGFSELSVAGGPRVSKIASRANGTAVAALNNGAFAFDVYAGPQEWKRLVALGRDFENANPYGGWLQGVVQPFATMVVRTLLWMKETLGINYGWVLIIFGIAVRLVLWPLNQRAMRTSMAMQRIQPEIQAIQKRYANDPPKLQAEMLRVYKEHNMSPFSSFTGCLPMLIPMPVFFALFFVFQNTIEFRGVPFLWLHDISLRDPFYILPVFVALTAFALSWIGMRNQPPNPQTKVFSYAIPAMMLFFFVNVASGLNLYYAVQNLASLPQQWLLSRERAKTTKGVKPVAAVAKR
jgi:YidC/Oxa1 family membrane protein insertase